MADQKSRLMPTAQTYALSTNPGSFCAHGQPLQPHAEGWLRLRQFTHKFWILEALASILSLVLFAVIVAVLLFYDNRIYGVSTRQSDGMKRPHVFFYLAFLSAVMRATMLLPVAAAIGQLKWSWFRSPQRLVDIERFNEAAGGILGSAKLMFTLRFRLVTRIFPCFGGHQMLTIAFQACSCYRCSTHYLGSALGRHHPNRSIVAVEVGERQ